MEYVTRKVEESDLDSTLREMGANGWELHSMIPRQVTGYTLLFERKVPPTIETAKKASPPPSSQKILSRS